MSRARAGPGTGGAGGDAAPPPSSLVERLRDVHLGWSTPCWPGDGLGAWPSWRPRPPAAPVAIVVPRIGVAAVAPARRRGRGRAAGAQALRRRPAARPPGRGAGGRGQRGADRLRRRDAGRGGAAGGRRAAARRRRAEFLHLAAVASLTEVAVEEAKEEVEQNLRGSFLEELRSRAELEPGRDRAPGRPPRLRPLARGGRAVRRADLGPSPPRRGDDRRRAPGRARPAHGRPRVRAAARRRVRGRRPPRRPRPRRASWPRASSATAPSGCRRSTSTPVELPRAVQEAELVLDVLRQSDAPIAEDIGTGTYRLLFRVLASHPEEVRSFYEDTVAPIVALRRPVRDRPRRHARGLPRAELQHERDGGGDLRPPPHRRVPPRPRARADGPRPDAVRGPRAARVSG